MKKFYASNEQKDILSCFLQQSGSVIDIASAAAGSGKTATILYMLFEFAKQNPYVKSLYLVFNAFMKREIENKIANPSYGYNDALNENNLECFTLHGYIRMRLQELDSEVGFYHLSGELDKSVFAILLERSLGLTLYDETFHHLIDEQFKRFNIGIKTIDEFESKIELSEEQYQRLFSGNSFIFSLANKWGLSSKMSLEEAEEMMNNAFYFLASQIYEKRAIIDTMPHSFYYKYFYLAYDINDVDLFQGFERVIIDEAQDLDPIIMAYVKSTKVPAFLFGDRFQQINRFRGSESILSILEEETGVKSFKLTKSYRLSPQNAFVASALLNYYAKELDFGYDEKEPIAIYGNSAKQTTRPVQSMTTKEYIGEIVDRVAKIDVEQSEQFREWKERESFRKTIKKLLPPKERSSIMNLLKILSKEKDRGSDFIAKLTDAVGGHQLKNIISMYEYLDFIGEDGALSPEKTKRNLFEPKGRNLVKEIISEAGQYALVGRNNAKVLDMLYSLSEALPKNDIGNGIPLFHVKFSSSMESGLEQLNGYSLKHIRGEEQRKRIIKSLQDVVDSSFGQGVLGRFFKASFTPQNIQVLLRNLKESEDGITLFKIGNKSIVIKSDAERGRFYNAVYEYLDQSMIAQLLEGEKSVLYRLAEKKRDKSEAVQLLNGEGALCFQNRKLMARDFLPMGDLLLKCDKNDVFMHGNKNIVDLFYYMTFKRTVDTNPNIELVGNGKFFNIYLSTVHQVKGLEFKNIFLANDLAKEKDDMEAKEKIDEFNLAYVALTRAEENIVIESTYDEQNECYVQNDFHKLLSKSCDDFSRKYISDGIIMHEKMSKGILSHTYISSGTGKELSSTHYLNIPAPHHGDIIAAYNKDDGKLEGIYNKLNSDFTPQYNAKLEYFKPVGFEEAALVAAPLVAAPASNNAEVHTEYDTELELGEEFPF